MTDNPKLRYRPCGCVYPRHGPCHHERRNDAIGWIGVALFVALLLWAATHIW